MTNLSVWVPPAIMTLGFVGQILVFWRMSAVRETRRDERTRNTEQSLAGELGRLATSLDGLEKTVGALGKQLQEHTTSDAIFQATTAQTMESVKDALKAVVSVATDNALMRQDIQVLKDAIAWGTAQFESHARQISKLAQGKGMMVSDDLATGRAPPLRRPRG